MLKKVVLILFILVVLGLGSGFVVLEFLEDQVLGQRLVGLSVVAGVFILMPLFLYIRLKGKKLKDYTLTSENIKKMRDKLDR